MTSTIARWCGAVAAIGMGIMAVLHALWALGTGWPAETTTVLYEAVTPSGDGTVPGGITMGSTSGIVFCVVMAGLLFAAAYVVGARAGVVPRFGPSWGFRRVPWVVAGIFLMRGLMRGNAVNDPTYLTWNRGLYSPLALALAVLTVVVCVLSDRAAHRSAPRPSAP